MCRGKAGEGRVKPAFSIEIVRFSSMWLLGTAPAKRPDGAT